MIKLYHGTDCLFDAPDLAKCNPNKDFGRGFYLTPDLAAAKRMAERDSFHTPKALSKLTFKEAKRV